VATAAPLRGIALRAPRAASRLRAERTAYYVRANTPYARRDPNAAQRALRIVEYAWDGYDAYSYLSRLASERTVQQVRISGDGSVEQAVLAYYTILDKDDVGAGFAMWIDPDPTKTAWIGVRSKGSSYRVHSIAVAENDGYYATTRVNVTGQNRGERAVEYMLDIMWARTEFGWLQVGQKEIWHRTV
jgi:hypothetical protein